MRPKKTPINDMSATHSCGGFCNAITNTVALMLIGLLTASTATGQTQSWPREYPTLFVLVAPSQLLTRPQIVGPQVIDEMVGRRRVSSYGIATTNVQIQSVPSSNSAMLRLLMDGTTDGCSVSTIRRRDVLSDDSSRFQVEQLFALTTSGINALPPNVQIQTHRELEQVKSQRTVGRFLGSLLTNGVFFVFPTAIDRKASSFSEQKLRERLAGHGQMLDNTFNRVRMIAGGRQISESFFPEWQTVGISSTERVWRFKAGSHTSEVKPPPLHVLPVSVRVHNSPLNNQLQRDFGGKTLNSLELDGLRNRISGAFDLPALKVADDKPWSVTFAEQSPLRLEFEDDSISLSVVAQKLTSGENTTPELSIEVRYSLQYEDQRWLAVRDKRIDVQSAQGRQLGARQQVTKTVTRRRFERLFPERIDLPQIEFAGIDRSSENSGGLIEFKTIAAKDGWIAFALGHKH